MAFSATAIKALSDLDTAKTGNMKYLPLIAILLLAAVGATYWHYRSLDPCDWMAMDSADRSGLPLPIVRARIAGEFLLKGITDPAPLDCVVEWWRLRQDNPPPSR